ncbi:hypothetical protein TI03_06260, partial [Achromatium sp. WMS1]
MPDKNHQIFSFELFPPKTAEGLEKLKTQVAKLNKVEPRYISVTYGADSTTRKRTHATEDWQRSQDNETATHLPIKDSQQQKICTFT